jgi:hypothetical protein
MNPPPEHARAAARNCVRCCVRHVADGRAGEEADAFPGRRGARRRQHEGPQEIRADGVDLEPGIVGGQRLGGGEQMFARDVDRRIDGRLLERVQQQARLAAGAATVVDDVGGGPASAAISAPRARRRAISTRGM